MSWNRPKPREKQWEGDELPKPRPHPIRISSGLSVACVVPEPKQTRILNEPYRRWVAGLACCSCGIEGFTQAAHPNSGRGLGQKASDEDCFPLCSARPGHQGCHAPFDQLVDITRDQRRELEAIYTAKTQAMAMLAGVLK